MHEAGTQSWFTGTTQKDRLKREVGGGFRMVGNVADSCQYRQKNTPQYCKVIRLQLK